MFLFKSVFEYPAYVCGSKEIIMIDLKLLRGELTEVVTKLQKKHFEFDSNLFLYLDRERKNLQIKAESIQAERNLYSKSVGNLIKEAKENGEDIESLKQRGED